MPANHITEKRKLRNEAYQLEQLALTAKQNSEISIGDYFDRIAAFLGFSATAAQMMIYWGYGFSLELVACLLAILALHKSESKSKTRPIHHVVKPQNLEQEKTQDSVSLSLKHAYPPVPPQEHKELIKTYITEVYHNGRFRGLSKFSLSRRQWENVHMLWVLLA